MRFKGSWAPLQVPRTGIRVQGPDLSRCLPWLGGFLRSQAELGKSRYTHWQCPPAQGLVWLLFIPALSWEYLGKKPLMLFQGPFHPGHTNAWLIWSGQIQQASTSTWNSGCPWKPRAWCWCQAPLGLNPGLDTDQVMKSWAISLTFWATVFSYRK